MNKIREILEKYKDNVIEEWWDSEPAWGILEESFDKLEKNLEEYMSLKWNCNHHLDELEECIKNLRKKGLGVYIED